MNPDYSKPLRLSQHEKYCLEILKGSSQVDAHEAAGYARGRKAASLLAKNADIRGRIAWLKQQAADTTVLGVQEKREFLARLVRAKIGELDGSSDLLEEYSESEAGTKAKLPSKIAAIKLDNDLAEVGSEAKAQSAAADTLSELLASIRKT